MVTILVSGNAVSYLVQLYSAHPYLLAVSIVIFVVVIHFVYRTCSRPTIAESKTDFESFTAPLSERFLSEKVSSPPTQASSRDSMLKSISKSTTLNRPAELKTRRESMVEGLSIAHQLNEDRKSVLTVPVEFDSAIITTSNDKESCGKDTMAQNIALFLNVAISEDSDTSLDTNNDVNYIQGDNSSVDEFDVGNKWLKDSGTTKLSRNPELSICNVYNDNDDSSESESNITVHSSLDNFING
jgi:hypothetical protein